MVIPPTVWGKPGMTHPRFSSGLQPSRLILALAPGAMPQAGIGRAFGPKAVVGANLLMALPECRFGGQRRSRFARCPCLRIETWGTRQKQIPYGNDKQWMVCNGGACALIGRFGRGLA